MSITRIAPGSRMSGAVVHGDTIYVSGHVCPDGSLGVREQTAYVLARIEERLAAAGSEKSRVLSAQIWLADIATFDEMNAVWDAWVDQAHPPARATVQARLASPDCKVEIAVIAAR